MLNKTLNIELTKKYPISVSFPKGLDEVSIERPFNSTKSGLFIMEIWKDIKGYEGYYQISNLGRVKSLFRIIPHKLKGKKTIPEKILKLSVTSPGYYMVGLFKNCKGKRVRIHRLIALYFIPNPENKPEINHKNGIMTDNRIENLEWVTRKENCHHAQYVLGKSRAKKVIKLNNVGEIIAEYESAAMAARKNNLLPSLISRSCATGIKHGGYNFKLKENIL